MTLPPSQKRRLAAHEERTAANEDLAKSSYILIESKDMMNVNLTPSAYKIIMYLTKITTAQADDATAAGSLDDDAFSATGRAIKAPLKFRNFLGLKCDLMLAPRATLMPEHAIGFNLVTGSNLASQNIAENMAAETDRDSSNTSSDYKSALEFTIDSSTLDPSPI